MNLNSGSLGVRVAVFFNLYVMRKVMKRRFFSSAPSNLRSLRSLRLRLLSRFTDWLS